MKNIHLSISILMSITLAFGQNQNISGGNVFDGEPYISINPNNPHHIVVAWMGFVPFNRIAIKTKVTFDAGTSWSNATNIPHAHPLYGSADPSLEFDNSGNVFLAYVDYNAGIDSGAVYVAKSTDGGITWTSPVEVINAHSDEGKYPVDRPWIAVDRSGGTFDGNIYVTTMPPNIFGPLLPPYNPYFIRSTDGGATFQPWKYLDTIGWLAGSLIFQPMPTPAVSANGTFHAVYPSWFRPQNIFPQYFIASSGNEGLNFSYNVVFTAQNAFTDTLAKKGYLLITNPANANHLAFLHLGVDYGDADVFLRESFDGGVNWTSPVRVNDDPIGNNRMQDLVWADFDNDGDLVVSWRDRRNGTDDSYATASEIWGAVRWKDSTGFSANFRISDTIVAYDTILAESGNDFMCIKFVDDTLSAVWGDTRTGKLNIWFQRMTLNGTIVSIRQLSSENMPDVETYPNPAVSEVTIKGKNLRKLEVFDETGREASITIDKTDRNNWKIDASYLARGIYFFQITTKEGMVTKKIVKK